MKRLLLLGAGHAHAQVLKSWIAAPLPDTELVLVSPHVAAPYSGMVPGWLAGRYRYPDICINFGELARAAGARFVCDAALRMDAGQRQVHLQGGAVVDYDVASLNIGSTLQPPAPAGVHVLSMRPLDRLQPAWDALLAALAGDPRAPLRVTAVGAGAAGVESLLAALVRLRALWPRRPVQGVLVSRSASLVPGLAPAAVRALQRALTAAEVTVRLDTDYAESIAQACDLLLWATGAQAHAWPRDSGLAVAASGFVRVDAGLRSVSHPEVHAAGDCAELPDPVPKAGVYAVRMGPVLSRNLRAALGAGSAVDYVPQRRYLSLLGTGDGRAVAAWGRWSAHGPGVWRWKDHIDRGFVRRFAHVRAARSADDAPGILED